jgi:hypothetical protein
MSKPLSLFINPADPWRLVYGYGPELPVPATGPVSHNYVLVKTTGTGEVFTACYGKLSVRPPSSGGLDPLEPLSPPAAGSTLPDTVRLYLHVSPLVYALDPAFKMLAAQVFGIAGFVYFNIETASLESALAELLVNTTMPPLALSKSQVVWLLVNGILDVYVTAGHSLGKASSQNAPAGSRQVGFAVLSEFGPIDPSHVYDRMRDFVTNGQPEVDSILSRIPKQWPVINPSLSKPDAINLTALALYSLPVLEQLRTDYNLSAAEWRELGNNQKNLWRGRLLRRVGHAAPASADPPFEFDDLDWKNIFQLEAVVELYANYDDPWAAGSVPRNPGDAGYVVIDFLDPAGTSATVAGNNITLDGSSDLGRIRINYDTIFLNDDTARPTHLYRIRAVNLAARTVTVDGAPILSGDTSSWRISLRPVIVIVDSFGAREMVDNLGRSRILGGVQAVITPPDTITLDGSPDLRKVNPNFDTVYLPSDTARPSRTYRIRAVSNAMHTITVNGRPVLDGGSSLWHIPAGISGELPSFHYDLGPGGAAGFDHYDGILFLIQNNIIHNKFRWTSYTSRVQREPDYLSSIRGNSRYDFRSFRSPNSDFRNYSLAVIDPAAHYDGVRDARFYFSTPVAPDRAPAGTVPRDRGPGKTEIRFHHGLSNRPGGTRSAGCIVAPIYHLLRDRLIDLYQAEFAAFHGAGNQDREVRKVYNLNQDRSVELWTNTQNRVPGTDHLTEHNWNNKIKGTLWLIRPDERPERPEIS